MVTVGHSSGGNCAPCRRLLKEGLPFQGAIRGMMNLRPEPLKIYTLQCWPNVRLDVGAMKNVLAFPLLFSSVLLLGQNQSSSVQTATNAATEQAFERLAADTPKTTVLGNVFVAPKDWSIRIKGPATVLTAPEGAPGSHLSTFRPRGRMKR